MRLTPSLARGVRRFPPELRGVTAVARLARGGEAQINAAQRAARPAPVAPR